MIKYHGTPFAGGIEPHLALTGRHAMVSFWRDDSIDIVAEVCQSFCLDNGAFSAWKSGAKIDWDDYMAWAEHWLLHPGCDFAIIPDVIDGTEQDNDNIVRRFENRHDRERWVPVWHLNESIGRLKSLAQSWPRVALGSSGEYSEIGTAAWWQKMGQALDCITDQDGRPWTRLHGLRMLDTGLFSYIPFASADSTNVARNIGMDQRWYGPYVPKTKRARASVMIDRIDSHACASHWVKGKQIVNQQNFELLG
jgi:hypothetical protein